MSSNNSPRQAKERPAIYERFIGLETLRDSTAQDIGSKQPLTRLSNGNIDAIGQIVKDPGYDRIGVAYNVVETIHFNINDILWVERSGATFTAKSTTGRTSALDWNKRAVPYFSTFNTNALILSQGEIPYYYTGAAFAQYPSNHPLSARLRPSFGVTVQSRYVVAGMPQYPGTIEVSRVNDLNYFSEEESSSEESVNRAGKIDLWSVLGRRETITGLGCFETNKLIIFTANRGVIYRISTDIDQWGIEDKIAITNGCISHRTICEAGRSIFYCSRNGVYAITRSDNNGTAVSSIPLSGSVGLLYRRLVKLVPDPRLISAVWDQDEGNYHIFFPQSTDRSYRLTMAADPNDPTSAVRWSLSEGNMMPLCGAFHEGSLVFGSSDGLYEIGRVEEDGHETYQDMVVETPILYLGSFDEAKQITGMIVSASGKASLLIEVIDVDKKGVIFSQNHEVDEDADPASFYGTPLSKRRRIPMNLRTTSCIVRITAKGKGLFRLAGFAFNIGS